MSMDVSITSPNLDSANNVKVALTQTPNLAGHVVMASLLDTGSVTGSGYSLRYPQVSTDNRLRIGSDTVLFQDYFNASAQNTNLWSYTFATLTAAMPGAGTVNFSTVQGTTSAHGAFMRSFQHFPVWAEGALAVDFTVGQFTAALVANEIWLCGLGIPSAAVTPPTDGIWFQLTSAGLIGVTIFSGATTQTGTLLNLSDFTVGSMYELRIVVGQRDIEFYRDGILLGSIPVPVANPTVFQQGSLPLFMMKYNSGAVSSTNTMRVGSCAVKIRDVVGPSKPYGHQMAGQGLSAYVGLNGGTMGTAQAVGTITTGSTPNFPTNAAGSNSVANVTGLGGWGSISAAAAANTDFIATSFTVPASTINITARNLYITGVAISAINAGNTVATTPTTLLWSVAFGATAANLQTAETASFATATTHAPRRVQLGFMSAAIAANIGTPYTPDVIRRFDGGPIVVRPGETLMTAVKIVVGTATASQIIVYNVTFDGYYE